MLDEADRYGLQHAIISLNPRILLIAIGAGGNTGYKIFSDETNSLEHLCEILGVGGHLIFNPWWHISKTREWDEILDAIRRAASKHVVTPHFFCNSQSEVAFLVSQGFNAILLNHNTFSNENVFRIVDTEKKYDAIYNAKMVPFKRHELAQYIENVALIYSQYGDLDKYFPYIKKLIPQAKFLNGDPTNGSYQMLTPLQVCEVLNQARTGLCLSKEEGAMYASVEYLLCGLPVVSTHSVGGRDVFFDDRYCSIVDADPAAVRDAAIALALKNIDPNFIREETLKKIESYRRVFYDYIDAIQLKNGVSPEGELAFKKIMDGPWSCWTYRTISGIKSALR